MLFIISLFFLYPFVYFRLKDSSYNSDQDFVICSRFVNSLILTLSKRVYRNFWWILWSRYITTRTIIHKVNLIRPLEILKGDNHQKLDKLHFFFGRCTRKRWQRFVFALAVDGTTSLGETHNSIPKRNAQWGGNYATEFATSRPPKARCPNRKWIKSIEVQFRSWVADIIGNSAIMIMVGNSAQNSDRGREREKKW